MKDERKAFIDKNPVRILEDDRIEILRAIDELIARKEQFFSRYRRMIINFRLDDEGDEWQITVSYSFDELPEKPEVWEQCELFQ